MDGEALDLKPPANYSAQQSEGDSEENAPTRCSFSDELRKKPELLIIEVLVSTRSPQKPTDADEDGGVGTRRDGWSGP